jgi:hypothetical protein
MTQTATSANKVVVGLAAAAMASAAFATSALGSAPTAHATCASFWGIGNGNGCTSTFGTMAIAIGTGAIAEADGFFSSAFAVGPNSFAQSIGNLSTAIAVGATGGTFNTAAVAGNSAGDFLNTAISLGNDSEADAGFAPTNIGNLALNLGVGNFAESGGVFSTAMSVGGSRAAFPNNNLTAVGTFNGAFSFFGDGNQVTASPGPFAIAGSIFQTDATVTKKGPGFNINGVSVGGAAAPAKAATTVKAAAVAGGKKKAPASAAAKHTSTK